MKRALADTPREQRRAFGWDRATEAAAAARDAGCQGVVLMGLKFETIVNEAANEWQARAQSVRRL